MDIDAAQVGWVPAACRLPTGEQPLRVAEFDAPFAGSVRSATRPDPQRLRLELDPSPAVAARAAELAARETACCSFFTFTVTVAGGDLRLEVAVPDGQAAILDGLAARTASAGSAGSAGSAR